MASFILLRSNIFLSIFWENFFVCVINATECHIENPFKL